MRLHLDRERDEPLLWEETVVLDPGALGQDLIVELAPIEVRGRVDRIDDDGDRIRGGSARSKASLGGPASFQVGMDLRYEQGLACTRCLQPVRSAVATHVDLMVSSRPRGSRGKEAGRAQAGTAAKAEKAERTPSKKAHARDSSAPQPEIELEKDELGTLVVEDEHLDTEPLIAEQILLEVPMKPLCTPECRGLCPRCGADRNLTPDCCEEPAGDERWEALGALRDQLSADGR
jgi:uncharacterized protein